MSYPTEDQKGRYISLFWTIWSMGAVIGSIIPTAQNWSNTSAGRVNDGTYIALFVLMLGGSVLAMFLVHPSKIVRDDGTKVYVVKHASLWTELKNVVKSVKVEPWIILFFPYAFAGLWYGVYQSNDYNAYFFDVRTRSFNSIWYNVAQMVSAGLLGLFLDIKYFNRRSRALLVRGASVCSICRDTANVDNLGVVAHVRHLQCCPHWRYLSSPKIEPRSSCGEGSRRQRQRGRRIYCPVLLLWVSRWRLVGFHYSGTGVHL